MSANLIIIRYSDMLKKFRFFKDFKAFYHLNFDNEYFKEYVADES